MLLPVASAAIVIAQELLIRRSLPGLIEWLRMHPAPFAVNVLLAAVIFSTMIGLTGRTIAGLITGAGLMMVLATVNVFKLMILHDPFFAWDLLYIRQMGALGTALVSGHILLIAGLCALALFLFTLYRFWKKPRRVRIKIRLLFLGVAALLAGVFVLNTTNTASLFGIQNINWDQTRNYDANGFLLAFSMNITPALITRPEGYSRDMVARLVEGAESSRAAPEPNPEPVSLVIVMSEGFSRLVGASYQASDDPYRNIDRLSARFPEFTLISPTFAGNTSLAEFEVLTGLSNAFLPPGAIPFDHYLRRPTPSLVSVLKDRGYETVAMHPFHAWFWHRDRVYPNLGFERFISLEDFEGAPTRGKFVSDAALVDKMIDVIDAAKGPYMLYAVSMENHMPYLPDAFNSDVVGVKSDYPERLNQELSTYLTGIRDADRALGQLTRYLSTRPEPVILLFFGDHQPNIGPAFYHLSGILKQGLEMDLQLSRVPALLWSNRKGLLHTEDLVRQISPSYIPGILLRQMGITLPPQMLFSEKGLSDYPVIHRNLVTDHGGHPSTFLSHRQDPFLKNLEILTYDILFGKQFSSDF